MLTGTLVYADTHPHPNTRAPVQTGMCTKKGQVLSLHCEPCRRVCKFAQQTPMSKRHCTKQTASSSNKDSIQNPNGGGDGRSPSRTFPRVTLANTLAQRLATCQPPQPVHAPGDATTPCPMCSAALGTSARALGGGWAAGEK
jgi:hypothetical protein